MDTNRIIINLRTGETRTIGYYAYWGEGLPDGWKDLDTISKQELVDVIQGLVKEKRNLTLRNSYGL